MFLVLAGSGRGLIHGWMWIAWSLAVEAYQEVCMKIAIVTGLLWYVVLWRMGISVAILFVSGPGELIAALTRSLA